REFGGGRRAQLLAAVATATMPALLAIDHLTGPTAFDVLAWAGLAFIVARIGRTGDCRWWVAGGVVLGPGLANKHSAGFSAVAKIYYLAGAYVYLLAAGAVAIDGWLAARRGRFRNLLLATAVTTAAALPLVLPVLPAADIGWTYPVNQALGESVGWPQLVRT